MVFLLGLSWFATSQSSSGWIGSDDDRSHEGNHRMVWCLSFSYTMTLANTLGIRLLSLAVVPSWWSTHVMFTFCLVELAADPFHHHRGCRHCHSHCRHHPKHYPRHHPKHHPKHYSYPYPHPQWQRHGHRSRHHQRFSVFFFFSTCWIHCPQQVSLCSWSIKLGPQKSDGPTLDGSYILYLIYIISCNPPDFVDKPFQAGVDTLRTSPSQTTCCCYRIQQ